MTSILETEVTKKLTLALGRAPTVAEIANGLLSPYPLSQVYRTLNTPQSIFSIGPTDDIQDALDSLASNGGGVLNLLPGNFILPADILMPTGVILNGAGPTNTKLIGSAGFVVKAHGTSMVNLTDVGFMNLGIYGCILGSALDLQYITRLILSNVQLPGNANGLLIDNSMQINMSTVTAASSTGYGITVSNSSLMDWRSVNAVSNGTTGLVLNTVATMLLQPGDFEGNTGAGIIVTGCTGIRALVEASNNGGNGITVTSSDDTKIFNGGFFNNGGYGIDIANAGSDDTIILGNSFDGNSSGAVNDSGTGTLVRSNVGVADN